MPFDFAKPFQVPVKIPGTSRYITLLIKRPGWTEADRMRRRKSELSIKSAALYEKVNPTGPRDIDELKPEDQVAARASLREWGMANEELNNEFDLQAIGAMSELVVGFVDRDEAGEPLFNNDGEPFLSEKKEDFWPVLVELLGRTLSDLWRQLADKVQPDKMTLKLEEDLAKNSTQDSDSSQAE